MKGIINGKDNIKDIINGKDIKDIMSGIPPLSGILRCILQTFLKAAPT